MVPFSSFRTVRVNLGTISVTYDKVSYNYHVIWYVVYTYVQFRSILSATKAVQDAYMLVKCFFFARLLPFSF